MKCINIEFVVSIIFNNTNNLLDKDAYVDDGESPSPSSLECEDDEREER